MPNHAPMPARRASPTVLCFLIASFIVFSSAAMLGLYYCGSNTIKIVFDHKVTGNLHAYYSFREDADLSDMQRVSIAAKSTDTLTVKIPNRAVKLRLGLCLEPQMIGIKLLKISHNRFPASKLANKVSAISQISSISLTEKALILGLSGSDPILAFNKRLTPPLNNFFYLEAVVLALWFILCWLFAKAEFMRGARLLATGASFVICRQAIPCALGLFCLLGAFQMFYLVYYSVDLPFSDDIDVYFQDRTFTLSWIFALHNEHRVVFTKLLAWGLYELNGLDFRWLIASNYVIYMGIVATLMACMWRFIRRWPFLICFFLPFFSTNTENLIWGFLSSHFFMVFFCVLAIYVGFCRARNKGTPILVALLLSCSIFSMSFAYALGAYVIYLGKEVLEWRKAKKWSFFGYYVALPTVLMIAVMAIFTHGMGMTMDTKSPLCYDYWRFLCGLYVYSLLRFSMPHFLPPLIVVSFVAIALSYLYGRGRRLLQKPRFLAMLALVSAAVLCQAAITFGRYNFLTGNFYGAVNYCLYGLCSLPCIAIFIHMISLKYIKSKFWRIAPILLLAVAVFYGFHRYYKYEAYYRDFSWCKWLRQAEKNIGNYYAGRNDGEFEFKGYNGPISKQLDYAKKKDFAFVKRLCHEETPKP